MTDKDDILTVPSRPYKPTDEKLESLFLELEKGSLETLVVGDRLETDIAAGQAAGCKTALVLSGVSTKEQAKKWQPAPDVVVEDLASLVK